MAAKCSNVLMETTDIVYIALLMGPCLKACYLRFGSSVILHLMIKLLICGTSTGFTKSKYMQYTLHRTGVKGLVTSIVYWETNLWSPIFIIYDSGKIHNL